MIDQNLVRNEWRSSEKRAMRTAFGEALTEIAHHDERIVALAADLTESVGLGSFQKAHGARCLEVGVAEQNLVTVASGLAAMGYLPFAASYAAFNPGRNWEQIRTTICLNQQPVTVIGSHAGLNVGPDGATHQMLEDIALMRVLPNMTVLSPADAVEAAGMAHYITRHPSPYYVRLPREKTPLLFADGCGHDLSKAHILREGNDITLVSTGAMTHPVLRVAEWLAEEGIQAEVVHVGMIKPFDDATIVASAKKTGRVAMIEEAQIAGGLGGLVAETLAEQCHVPLKRLGVRDEFGESGTAAELLAAHHLDEPQIVEIIKQWLREG